MLQQSHVCRCYFGACYGPAHDEQCISSGQIVCRLLLTGLSFGFAVNVGQSELLKEVAA